MFSFFLADCAAIPENAESDRRPEETHEMVINPTATSLSEFIRPIFLYISIIEKLNMRLFPATVLP